jgi:dTDP-4-amino-4,6-dideoxygalactose transaminase
MTIHIPLARPEITDADREAVMNVWRTPYLSTGPKVEEFERAVCDYTGSAHAVAVNSGTSALQLAIRALEIERGAEVILPSFTFSAVLNTGVPQIVRPPLASDVGRISWFVYPVRLTGEFTAVDRDRICEAMLGKAIATGRYFAPLHQQPVIRTTAKTFTTEDTEIHRGRHTEEDHESRLPNTEFVADRMIALPFFNELTAEEIQEVCAALADSIHEVRCKT